MENQNQKATYCFRQYLYEKGMSETIKVPCEIIGETEKRYEIKLLAPNVNGHNFGDKIKIQKRNVILPEPELIQLPEEEVAVEHYWWQDL